jgi:hypothetical protein
MARWIAFDQKTSSILRSILAQGTTVMTFGRGPIDYALAKPGAVVTLLPATGGPDVGIAVFRRPRKRVASPALASVPKAAPLPAAATGVAKVASSLPPRGPRTRAGGFLGLSDESYLEDEPSQERKSWWRRFWEE